jgi:hypothetical protein
LTYPDTELRRGCPRPQLASWRRLKRSQNGAIGLHGPWLKLLTFASAIQLAQRPLNILCLSGKSCPRKLKCGRESSQRLSYQSLSTREMLQKIAGFLNSGMAANGTVRVGINSGIVPSDLLSVRNYASAYSTLAARCPQSSHTYCVDW